MHTTNKYFAIGAAILLLAVTLMMSFGAVGLALSETLSSFMAPTATPPPGDPIPLKPVTGLTSLNATVNIGVNGLINGERAQGDLQAVVTTNDQKQSKVTVTGSLLGEIAAQVGGSVVGLFTPSSVDIYKVPEGTYIVVNSFVPVCVKPKPKSTDSLDDFSPQGLLSMLTSSDVARGKFVGDETLNGAPVKHYVINGEAFLAAAKKSSNPKLKSFGEALWSAEDADLFVDAKGGFPVAFSGAYSGEYEPLKFEGDFTVQTQITGVNQNTPVNLPKSCNNPITP